MSHCNEIKEQVFEFLLNEVDPATHSVIQAHLRGCAHCQKAFEESRLLLGEVQSIPFPQPSDLFFQRQFKNIQEKISVSPYRRVLRWLQPALAAAAVISVFILGGILFSTFPNRGPSPAGQNQAALERINPPTEINLDNLDQQQLHQLTEQLEESILQKLPARDFVGDGADIDDLDSQELDRLIHQLETTEFRRKS